ncbi:MAG: PKD domain-containing protein [Candidatus Diapherotrites archaeon]
MTVNKLPVAHATTMYNPYNNEWFFDAGTSYDSDGSITGYEWDFGDGNTGTGSIASHKYSPPGFYNASLTVTDDLGFNGTYFFVPGYDANCGCKKMTIRSTGEFDRNDYKLEKTLIKNNISSDYNKLGGFDDINWLDSKKIFFIGTFFEVQAELTDNTTDPKLCDERQKTKATRHYKNKDFNYEFLGVKCGFLSPNWCNDDYMEKNDTYKKKHYPKLIKWIDAPGTRLRKGDMNVDGYTHKSKFWAVVEGSAGKCECFFEQEAIYNVNGIKISNTIKNFNGTNCFAG